MIKGRYQQNKQCEIRIHSEAKDSTLAFTFNIYQSASTSLLPFRHKREVMAVLSRPAHRNG